MNSSADSVAGLLAESLGCLEREAQGCHARMCQHMSGHALDLTIGRQRMSLRGEPRRLTVGPAHDAPVRVRTELATILAILGGELPIREAVRDDHLEVQGPIDRLLILHAALADYVHGAVRSPSFPALLTRLRSLHQRETGPI